MAAEGPRVSRVWLGGNMACLGVMVCCFELR